jgi:hypothetical protein
MNLIRLFRPLYSVGTGRFGSTSPTVSAVARHGIGLGTQRVGACAQAFDLRARPIDLGAQAWTRCAQAENSEVQGSKHRTAKVPDLARKGSTVARKPQTSARNTRTPAHKAPTLAAARMRGLHARGSRFACKTGGVARKAEEACAWGFEGCAWCCARRPRGQRLGARLSRLGGWDRKLGGRRSRRSVRRLYIYWSAGDDPIKLGIESAREPGHTWR